MNKQLFDSWTETYEGWFHTPWGQYVQAYESSLLMELLAPQAGEHILDAGCGTGIFTRDILAPGPRVTGIDLSLPMLQVAAHKLQHLSFTCHRADMCALPFADASFDKACSMTAIEFIAEAERAIAELQRVTRPGGTIVVTTLNSLSPWATQRQEKAKQGHELFAHVCFRSPTDMRRLIPEAHTMKTAIHFMKTDPVSDIPKKERVGSLTSPETGALLAVSWINQ